MRVLLRLFLLAPLLLTVAASAAEPQQDAVAVDKALGQLVGYDHSQPRRPLIVLEQWVARSTGDAELKRRAAERLAFVLASPDATPEAKRFVCEQLRLVGGDAQAALLEKGLADPQTADAARRALEAIPGEASLNALRRALARSKGPALVGVIDSLGNRRDAGAVGDLMGLLKGQDVGVASAAAHALGRIGTPEAASALLKTQVGDDLAHTLMEARLLCAQRLLQAGNATAASAIYEDVWDSPRAGPWRMAALTGLVDARGADALPVVLKAIRAEDGALQAQAARLTQLMPGEEVTQALIKELDALPHEGSARLIEALAMRRDAAAREALLKRLGSDAEIVKLSAIRALAGLGDETDVDALAHLAAESKGAVQAAARDSLARIAAPGVDKRILAAAEKGDPALRTELMRAMAARHTDGAVPLLLKAARDGDGGVRRAAFEALAQLTPAEAYPKLVDLLVSSAGSPDQTHAMKAVVRSGNRLPDAAARVGPVLAALGKADAKAKPVLLHLLGTWGGPEALAAVRAHLKDADPTVRDAAIRALAAWPDAGVGADLLKVAMDAEEPRHRVLALRGYLRLAMAQPEAERLEVLSRIRPIARTPDAKKMLLAGLADVPEVDALNMAASFLGDADVQAEAAAATLKISRGLIGKDPAAVAAAMTKLKAASSDEAAVASAEELAAIAKAGAPGAHGALARDAGRSEAIKQLLARRAPDMRLVCYLDCGPDALDGDGPRLRVVRGKAYAWSGCEKSAHVRFGTIVFDDRQVEIEATGLDPKKHYQLGFTWWDYDHDARKQSVRAAAKGAEEWSILLKPTKLPSFRVRQEHPQECTLIIPSELYAGGAVRIAFRSEGGVNAVLSEAWLWESDKPRPPVPPAKGMAMPPPSDKEQPAKTQAVMPEPEDRSKTNVLIVTGVDYPGHKWRETAPVLAGILRAEKRFEVQTLEDPHQLVSPKLSDYDVVVLHFMDWECPSPGAEARENLRKLIAGGKGLVLIHFACGAWQDWPEFEKLAGRVWNPKLRGHDPRGPFRVEIADRDHPVTRGMEAFETDDELYTCLEGDPPVKVLAHSKSKVDGRLYPMAFVLQYGKGRVFHTLLGHDVKAFRMPGPARLIRRGTAWAAGLDLDEGAR